MLQCEEIWMQMPIASLIWQLMRRPPNGAMGMNVCLVPRYRLWMWSLQSTLGIGSWVQSLGSFRAIESHKLTLQGRRKVRWDETTAINLCCDGVIVNVQHGRRPLRIAVKLQNGAAVILASFKPARPSRSARLALPIPGAPRNPAPLHARVRSSAA
jgi:hypothetical protein